VQLAQIKILSGIEVTVIDTHELLVTLEEVINMVSNLRDIAIVRLSIKDEIFSRKLSLCKFVLFYIDFFFRYKIVVVFVLAVETLILMLAYKDHAHCRAVVTMIVFPATHT
jgi:hypothetical protein